MSGAWGQGYGDGWEGEDEEGGQGWWGGGGKLIEGSVAMRRGMESWCGGSFLGHWYFGTGAGGDWGRR